MDKTLNPTSQDTTDYDVVNLAKAIRKHESNDNFNAMGDNNTSAGAYQWNNGKVPLAKGEAPANFKSAAKQYLGDENAPFTPENQNAVAYSQIKEWKDQGLNPAQIAAKWNSGSEHGWENKIGTTTIAGKEIGYNVPAYVKSVTDNYQQFKTGSQTPQNAPQTPETPQPDNVPKEGLISGLIGSVTNPISQLGGSIMSGISNLTGGALNQNVPVVSPEHQVQGLTGSPVDTFGYRGGQELSTGETAKQVAGNVLQNIATVGLPGVGGEIAGTAGLLSKAAKAGKTGIALGGLQGAGSALSEGKSIPEAIQSGATGALLGGVSGGTLGAIGGALSSLPNRLVQGAFGGVKPEVAQHALETKPLGTIKTMLNDSKQSLTDIGNKVSSLLSSPENKNKVLDGAKIFNDAMQGDPTIPGSGLANSGYTQDQLAKITRNLVKNQGALVDKLFKGELTLPESNTLKTALGKATFQTALGKQVQGPNITANKAAGRQIYFALANEIEKLAPGTGELFDQFEKEIPVANALQKMSDKGGVLGGSITMKELLAGMAAYTAGGIPGILGTGAYHIATSPLGSFAGGKFLGKLTKATGGKLYTTAGLLGKDIQSSKSTSSTPE